MPKDKIITNAAKIALGCLMTGVGVFLGRHGMELTARGVLPFLKGSGK